MNTPTPEPPNPGDPHDALEAELRLFAPAQPPADLRDSIAADLAQSNSAPRSNRLLLTFLSMGAAAAVTIISLLSLDALDLSHPPFPQSPASANSAATADSRVFIAQLASGQDPFENLPVTLPTPH